MPGQIVNVSNDQAISEVALKCGDPFFKDFAKNIYSQAVYRAEREVAHRYGILDRVWTYTNITGTSPVVIAPLNFSAAWRVTITPADGEEIEYTQMQLDAILDNDSSPTAIENFYYAIIYNANQYEINYTFPVEDDLITIYYVSGIAGEEDYEVLDNEGNVNAIPVLPNKYFEEIVRRAVRYMAKLGIAQFEGLKAERYSRVLNIYTKRPDEAVDNSLERDRPWILIKPLQYP